MTETVRTRFAPSPTGYLHIGGARTALFNYLLARRLGGRFVLRIEDTDQARNIDAADQKLLDDLRWLGLTWDEGPEVGGEFGPYYQSQRLDSYQQVTRELLERGDAYFAMETREELDAMRHAARQRGERGFRYPRPTTLPSAADAQRARDEGRPVVIRFKMPDRDFVIRDEILGDVTVGAVELSDFVIQKADGWPTYHFAVVLDDAAMRITHVLRGQEHLLNTANHMALQEALGYPIPQFAHLPIILTMQGAKMSKREKDKAVRDAVTKALAERRLDDARLLELSGCFDTDALTAWRKKKTQLDKHGLETLARELDVILPEIEIHDFRVSGYLPETLVNFIALLGWSAGDDREKYTLDALCEAFSLDRIGKTNAKFDREKLLSFNTTAATDATPQRRLAAFRDYISVNANSPFVGLADDQLERVLGLCAGFRTFRDVDFKAGALFAADDTIRYDAAAVKKWLRKGAPSGAQILAELQPLLDQAADWSAAGLEAAIKTYTEPHELGLGKVAQPLRIALTGTTVSPSIFESLALVGRERTLNRVRRLLAWLDAGEV